MKLSCTDAHFMRCSCQFKSSSGGSQLRTTSSFVCARSLVGEFALCKVQGPWVLAAIQMGWNHKRMSPFKCIFSLHILVLSTERMLEEKSHTFTHPFLILLGQCQCQEIVDICCHLCCNCNWSVCGWDQSFLTVIFCSTRSKIVF